MHIVYTLYRSATIVNTSSDVTEHTFKYITKY